MLQKRTKKFLSIMLITLVILFTFSTFSFTFALTNEKQTENSYLVNYNLQTK